jgi:2-iminobutanoate/2-iminopropanoate deaminase
MATTLERSAAPSRARRAESKLDICRAAFRSAAFWLTVLAGCGPDSKTTPPDNRSSTAERPPAIDFITPYGRPQHPFSPAVRVGHLLFLAGQLGTDSTGRLVPGGIKAETRQAMENIRDVVGRAGSSLDRVVKCTVMMADMSEWPAMNAVYASYFPRQFPARSAFGATRLALGARVEIECVAVAGQTD